MGLTKVTGKTIACEITNQQLKVMSKWQWTDEAMKKRISTGEDIKFVDTNICYEYKNLQGIKVVPADIVFKITTQENFCRQ